MSNMASDNLMPSSGRDSRGHPGADREIYDTVSSYYPSVRRFFIQRGFSVEESQDLTQETFLQAYRGIQRFRGDAKVATWLFQIASNVHKQLLRMWSTQKRSAEMLDIDGLGAVLLAGLPWIERERRDPLTKLLLDEQTRRLHHAFQGLPRQMQKVVIRRYSHGLRYKEIADLMSISIETVAAHLHQARQRLIQELGANEPSPHQDEAA